jgi:hypothetical protein
MRESIAAEAARKGLAGALAAAILGFLDAILALLAEFRAGALPAPAPELRDRSDANASCAESEGGAQCTAACELAAHAAPAAAGVRLGGDAGGERRPGSRTAVATVRPSACGDAGADRSPDGAAIRGRGRRRKSGFAHAPLPYRQPQHLSQLRHSQLPPRRDDTVIVSISNLKMPLPGQEFRRDLSVAIS